MEKYEFNPACRANVTALLHLGIAIKFTWNKDKQTYGGDHGDDEGEGPDKIPLGVYGPVT